MLVSAESITNLVRLVKDQHPNALQDVDPQDLIVWRCASQLSIKTTSSYIKALNFKTEAVTLEQGNIWDLHLDDTEMLIVQVPRACLFCS
jgi:hypothetical protein